MELSAKHASGEALSMEVSREFSRTRRRLPPCSDVSVLQKTRMSHFWVTHLNNPVWEADIRIRILVKRFIRNQIHRIGVYPYSISPRNAYPDNPWWPPTTS